ncbi:HEPN domain-containing protein [Mycobacterium vicinigordonae]|uniref:Uncharacterized protein n=1 Tax=Mycobacterium vicinigordonae TaxID=1719132 RepID=A0A7D6IAT9_9MYCO|nr:HEPN domain-containing protein [Mycobacterium vicinigordonae]QLL08997.1 hypothetical protein H0P51_08950 [Mycobacterium vicinigordonae]
MDSPSMGTFWQIDTPERRVPGQLVAGGDDRPCLTTDKAIFIERQFSFTRTPTGGAMVTISGDPEHHVEDFQERTIHGELTDGSPVTLVHAQGGSRSLGFLLEPSQARQRFRARYAVIGEHVKADQKYYAIRFLVVGPSWWGVAEDEAQCAGGGHLRMYRDDGSQWFEFTGSASTTFSDLDSGVINAVTTLTQLTTMNDATDADVQVRIEPKGAWRTVDRGRQSVNDSSHPLLDTQHLTAEKFAKWIDFRGTTQGLDAAVLDELPGVAIQTHVLTLGSVAEGLHRRLFGEDEKRVKGLSSKKIEKMRSLAREAALTKMTQPEFTDEDRAEFGKAINEGFSHINEQTFRSRMNDLLTDAQRSIPSLGRGFADWPDAVSTARNILAHQPSLPKNIDDEQFLDLLIALSYSITWVLRTNMLNKAGFDSPTMQEGYRYSSSYGHHLANTRTLLAGSPWAAAPD